MAYHNNPRIVTDGLVLCLDASHKKSYPGSGTTWYDLSGDGNSAQITNDFVFDAEYGGGLIFNSFNTKNYAIASMPKYNKTVGEYNTVCFFTKWIDGTNGFPIELGQAYRLWMNGYYLGFNTSAGDNYGFDLFPYKNKWIHITALFYNGSTYINNSKIYLNGSIVNLSGGNGTRPCSISSDNLFVIAGYRQNIASYPYYGNISSVQLYNRELSAAEILQNYNAVKGRFGL